MSPRQLPCTAPAGDAPGAAVRIVLAHAHPVIRKGFHAALGSNRAWEVLASVADAGALLRTLRRERPDVVLVEDTLPEAGVLPVLAQLDREVLAVRLVVVATAMRGSSVYQAMVAGAAGFVSTHEPVDEIERLLRAAAAGKRAFSARALKTLQHHLSQSAAGAPPPPRRPPLTVREQQVLQCMAEGLSIKGTAWRLHMSEATVKNHRRAIYAKLSGHNAPSAVFLGLSGGLLPAADE